jgi:uncharacterized protein (TIGR02001 family)
MHNKSYRRISREATMTFSITRFVRLAAASALSAALIAGPALADGPTRRGSIKDPVAPAPRACALSANVALTSEYVFRGVSQTDEGPAIQGGFDATCGLFYAGVWASNLDFGGDGAGNDIANIEVDFYAGIKPKTGPITWDLGVIYYAYPNSSNTVADLEMIEFKVGGSSEIWKGGTLGVTGFYSPDYTGELGEVLTVEVGFSQALPTIGMFTPTFSALIGHQMGDDALYQVAFGDDNYTYWNVGLTLGFLEKWSLDFRYWDTNLDPVGACGTALFQCDERFVATLKFTY